MNSKLPDLISRILDPSIIFNCNNFVLKSNGYEFKFNAANIYKIIVVKYTIKL